MQNVIVHTSCTPSPRDPHRMSMAHVCHAYNFSDLLKCLWWYLFKYFLHDYMYYLDVAVKVS